DLLTRHEVQNLGLQITERQHFIARTLSGTPMDFYQGIVGRPRAHLLLELRKPGTGRQPQLLEPVFPDVDMCAFLEGKRQRGHSMVLEGYRAHPEYPRLQQHSPLHLHGRQVFAAKTRSARKFCTVHAPISAELVRGDHEVGLIVLHEIPSISGELVFELGYESLRTVQTHARIAPEAHSQQVIEASKVVHVRV